MFSYSFLFFLYRLGHVISVIVMVQSFYACRSADIGKTKSVAGAAAAQRLNPSLHVTAHESRVGPDTENLFTDSFFASLDGVANALDNIEARL